MSFTEFCPECIEQRKETAMASSKFRLRGNYYNFADINSICTNSNRVVINGYAHDVTSDYSLANFLMEYAEWLKEESKPKLGDGWYHALNWGSTRYILYVKDDRYFAPWVCANLFYGGGDINGNAYTDFQPLNWGPLNQPENAKNFVKNYGRYIPTDWIYDETNSK